MQRNRFKENWSMCFVAAVLLGWLLFVLVRGQSLYAYVWDNLDGAVPQLKMLGDNKLFLAWENEIPFLNGLPRKYLYFSEFQLYNLLYAVFPAFTAYELAWFLRPIISISGSIFLGRSVLKKDYDKYKHIIILAAFTYSWMPVIPMQSFAIVSIPWFLAWVYNFYKKPDMWYALGLFFFPVLSDMNRIGIFLCGYLVLFFLIEWIVTKKPKLRLLFATAVLSIGYLLCEWRIVYIMLSGLETNRSTYERATASYRAARHNAIDYFLNGPIHALTLQKYVIAPVCLVAFLVSTFLYIKRRDIKAFINDKLNWVLGILILNSVVVFIDSYAPTKNFMADLVSLLGGLSLSNVTWLNPCLWSLALAISLIKAYRVFGKKVAILGIMAFLVIPFTSTGDSFYNDIGVNVRGFIYEVKSHKTYDNLFTYDEYYSEDLFDEILEDIDYKDEYSFAYCIEPSVLEYNQIKTVDGNCNFYPREYKELFGKLIAPVLEVREDYKEAFEEKGIYLFLFSPDVDHEAKKDIGVTKSELLVDKEILHQMGGRYIFSRVEIPNAKELDIEFINKYSNEKSPYTIYVYEID